MKLYVVAIDILILLMLFFSTNYKTKERLYSVNADFG